MCITQNIFTIIDNQLTYKSFRKRIAPVGPKLEKKVRCADLFINNLGIILCQCIFSFIYCLERLSDFNNLLINHLSS